MHTGSAASDPDAPVQTAIRALKREVKDLIVITDVCLCEYTSHGHCGIVEGDDIVNDVTVMHLAQAALSHAVAGADIVAPSDMMDGRVAAIRRTLDERGFEQTAIMSYAAKYCSGFYGPFREAADSTPQFGDRRSHQLDPANVEEALREVEIDIDEGADIVMVKPALPYLDVLTKVKERFGQPTAAYQVSGEYSMLKAAAQNGWLDEQRVMFETLTGIRRAGADMIITYYAREAVPTSVDEETRQIPEALFESQSDPSRRRRQSGSRVSGRGRHAALHPPRLGRDHRRRRRQSLHRLRDVVGAAHSRPRPTPADQGDCSGRPPRHELRRAERTGARAR